MTARALTEPEWHAQVVNLATLYRWMIHHDRPAMNRRGQWSTPIQGDPGFPDLVLVRSGHLLLVELKPDSGKLEPDQLAWRDRLLHAGADWRCWRPKDWPEVETTLKLAPASSWREHEDVAVKGRVL